MSTIEEKLLPQSAASSTVPLKRPGESAFSRLLRLVSSVRLGVTLLCLLGLACLIGMLVMQQNVDGFENYYAALTPAQRLLYGRLGFFNIYHVWYFNALLAAVSLNIILASMDRFPKSWVYVSKPQVTVPIRWLKEQSPSAEFANAGTLEQAKDDTIASFKEFGWKRIKEAEKNGRHYIFGDRNVWNRLGAYPVHVSLLTIFLGGFLTAQFGTTGDLPLAPGESSDLMVENVVDLDTVRQVTKQLPFEVTFNDIEQKLLRQDGSLSAGNTIDWITRFTIKDAGEEHQALVQMNRPYDYRGYRFFQASFTSVGRARNITLDVTPVGSTTPTTVKIDRNGSTTLADGTRLRFSEFRGNFRMGPEDINEDTSAFPNPAAIIQVLPPGGEAQTAYAFGPEMANLPVASKVVAGYTYRLTGFEKVADRHILSVQRDPGANVVYLGFLMLFLTLVAVFFFAHERVWVVIEEKGQEDLSVITGGSVNRNQNAFEDKFNCFVAKLTGTSKE